MQNKISQLAGLARHAFARAAQWTYRVSGRERSDFARARVYWDDSVHLALSNLVQETETRASGRVQLISLADFRAAIGDLWEKYHSRILIIVESTIARMIGRGNTFISQGDDAWLLLFSRLPEEKVQQRADAIATNIGQKLLGAQFTSHELPLPTAAKLDLAGSLNADGTLNMEAVKAAVSRIKQAQISAVGKGAQPSVHGPLPPAGAPRRSTAERLNVFFRPAWCAETECVDTFFFRAGAEIGVNAYAEAAPSLSDATVLELTKMATRAFTEMCDSGLEAKMGIPVPFSVLHGPMLSDIQRLIVNLRQRDRLLRLRLEVVRIPELATADILVAMRELFRPYVREVAFMVDLWGLHDQVLALDHIMLGADLTATSKHDDEDIFQAMLMFRQRAGRRGTYVLGLNSRTQLTRAISAGIKEVGGYAPLEDVISLPHRVTVLHRDKI